jgi:hypothetical protein
MLLLSTTAGPGDIVIIARSLYSAPDKPLPLLRAFPFCTRQTVALLCGVAVDLGDSVLWSACTSLPVWFCAFVRMWGSLSKFRTRIKSKGKDGRNRKESSDETISRMSF